MAVIDLKTDAGIRAERELRFKQLEAERTTLQEAEHCDATLKRLREELYAIGQQMEEVRNKRRELERQHAGVVVAREWLRHHKPKWVDEALQRLDTQRRQLMADTEQKRARESYLAQQVQLASRSGRPSQELLDKLDAAREELEPHAHQLAAISAEQGALIKRCTNEMWPQPDEVEAWPEAEPDQIEEPTAEHAGARRRVTPTRSK